MRIFSILLFFFSCSFLYAQHEKEKLLFELEEIYETEMHDDCSYERFLDNPIDLNNTSKEELMQSGLFTDKQIENILFYLYVYGEMKSLYEIKLIKDMDYMTIQHVRPYITINPLIKEKVNRITHQVNFSSRSMVSSPEGYLNKTDSLLYRNDKYVGDPFYLSLNYEGKFNQSLKWGIALEKDAGEIIRFIPDYSSFFFEYTSTSWLKKLIIGSYKLSLGKGLVMNNTYGVGFSSLHNFNQSRNQTVRKHNSFNETDYHQGGAIVLKHMSAELTFFGSYNKLDASSGDSVIYSFLKSGKHNTVSALSNRKNEYVVSCGFQTNYRLRGFDIGINYLYTTFSKPLISRYQSVVNRFHFKGKDNWNISANWEYANSRFRIAGEEAFSDKGIALLNLLQFQPKKDYLFSFVQRYYSPQYYSFYGRSLGNSLIRNEEGYYFFTSLYLGKGFYLEASYDYFKYLWASADSDFPKESSDLKLRLDNKFLDKWHFSLLFKQSRREKEIASIYEESYSYILNNQYRSALSLRVSYEFSRHILSQSLLEYALLNNATKSDGFHLSQIFTCLLSNQNYKLQTIISVFNGQKAVYFYSPVRHSLYAGSGERISGIGYKFQLNGSFRLYDNISLTLSYSLLHKSDADFIGNGLERIPGNKRHLLSVLCRIKF